MFEKNVEFLLTLTFFFYTIKLYKVGGSYMTNVDDITLNIKVVKRDGKKVDFDGSKIALAIKKGFDSVEVDEELSESKEKKYTEKDIQKVYQAVVGRIEKEYTDSEKIKIETIQDMIEDVLQKKGYEDVSGTPEA